MSSTAFAWTAGRSDPKKLVSGREQQLLTSLEVARHSGFFLLSTRRNSADQTCANWPYHTACFITVLFKEVSKIFCSLSLGPEISRPKYAQIIRRCHWTHYPATDLFFHKTAAQRAFRLNFKLLVQAFQLQVEDSLWILWRHARHVDLLLCVVAVVALRPEHDIHIHETAMDAHTQKITEEMEETNSEKDFPVPRCIVKNREPAARSKDKTSCKGKSEERCKQRSAKCKWCETKWQCPGKEEYWSRGEPLSPWEDLWRQLKFEFQNMPESTQFHFGDSKPVSLWRTLWRKQKKNWALPNVRCSST